MSNGPFFNSKSGGSKSLAWMQKQADIKNMHWTKYLEKYPLSQEPQWPKTDIDSHQNKWDMDLDDNITIKETT